MIQHAVRVRIADTPNAAIYDNSQVLYLDDGRTTWLDVDPCQGEDPGTAEAAAAYLDALAVEATKLADWYRAKAAARESGQA